MPTRPARPPDRAEPSVVRPGPRPAEAGRLTGLQQTVGNAAVSLLVGGRTTTVVQRRDLALKAEALLEGADVVDLQTKLKRIGVADEKGVEIAVPQTGKYDAGTCAAVKAFQRSRGLPVDGIVGDDLRKVIDAPTTLVDKTWSEKIRGATYGMTSKFDYQITDKQIHVTVKLNLKPKTAFDVAPHRDRWFQTIRDQWNIFKVAEKGGAKSRDIVFEPMAVGSGAHNDVNVHNATGTHDGGNFYTTYANGARQNELGVAHEFGHLLGLPDEYGQAHDDYRKAVGEDPSPADGALPEGADAAAVATKIKEALAVPSKDERATKLTALYADKKVTAGTYAMKIGDCYKTDTGRQLVDDLFSGLAADKRGPLIEPFVATAGGLMGSRYKSMDAPGSKDGAGHEHPLAPRHMAQFVDAVKSALGGDWEAKLR